MSHEVGSTGPSTPSSGSTGGSVASSAAAKLFDLFTPYGVVLAVARLFASGAERQKAPGININLRMGLGMLVLGLLFLLWWRVRPLKVSPREPD